MDRHDYLAMCRRAAVKMKQSGGWLGTEWSAADLVQWTGAWYAPVSYTLGFDGDRPTHTAVIRSTKANHCIIHAPLSGVSPAQEKEGANP